MEPSKALSIRGSRLRWCRTRKGTFEGAPWNGASRFEWSPGDSNLLRQSYVVNVKEQDLAPSTGRFPEDRSPLLFEGGYDCPTEGR